jgi:hypothetical protein
MISHSVETCPDDLAALRERLDAHARDGKRIVSVIWQPHRVEAEQSGAYGAVGSFVIVVETRFENPLRTGPEETASGVAPLA